MVDEPNTHLRLSPARMTILKELWENRTLRWSDGNFWVGNTHLRLSPARMTILKELWENRDNLLCVIPMDEVVHVHIHHIRKTMRAAGCASHEIINIRGRGYRMESNR